MKRISLFAVSLLLLCSVLISCGKSAVTEYGAIYNLKWKLPATSTEFKELDAVKDYTFDEMSSNLALFSTEKGTKKIVKIINLDTGNTVFTREFEKDDYFEITFIKNNFVLETDSFELYDSKGDVIKSKANDFYNVNDLIVMDGDVYRYDSVTGEQLYNFKRSELSDKIPVFNDWTDDYYYLMEDGYLHVYDKYLVPTKAKLYIPQDVFAKTKFIVLENGTAIVQYLEELPADASKYDLFMNATKYKMTSQMLNPKSGKISEHKTEYLYVGRMDIKKTFTGFEDMFKKNIKNFVLARKIDTLKNPLDTPTYILSMNNDAKISSTLEIENEYDMPIYIGDGVFMSLRGGSIVIRNKQGQALIDTSKVKDQSTTLLATESRVYDYKGELVHDFKDYKFLACAGEVFIYTAIDDETEIKTKVVYPDKTVKDYKQLPTVYDIASGEDAIYKIEQNYYDSNGIKMKEGNFNLSEEGYVSLGKISYSVLSSNTDGRFYLYTCGMEK